jgi:dienelactone hydrolase
MRPIIAALLACLALATLAQAARADDELERTWDAAWVYVPDHGAAGYRQIGVAGLPAYLESPDAAGRTIVLYAHGCDGLNNISAATGRFIAGAGYILVAPNSFARKVKPVSCIPALHQGSLHRAVLGWRQAEIRFAYEKIRAMHAADHSPIMLMGHSEGAITVATIGDLAVAGRIIEGWTCHAGWPEYRGLNAPAGQPVLTLVGEDDPWFTNPVLRGDCGAYMQGHAAHSIVYRAPSSLSDKHWLSVYSDVRRTILAFLQTLRPSEGK